MVLDMFISMFTEIIKDPIMQFVVVPIKRHISYPFNYKTKVERLQEEAQQLNSKRDRLQQSVADASRRGEEIYDDVSKWLISAGKAIQEAEQLIQAKEQAKERCFIGLCPNLKTRYHLSKKAEKKASLIDKLRNQGGLVPIGHTQPPKQKVAPSVYDREELPSRKSILKEIMDSLRDPNLNMIGVYGMGGVGKTTLAREVHRQAQDDKLFDVVIFVAVSQSPELRRIQAEVAEVLGLDLDEEGILLRANRLYERLNKEKILIILDDIWTNLQLEEVGIPFGADCKGCKILLTSRRRDVCHRMGAQKVLELEVLREEEAWNLFKFTVSVADGQEPKLPPLAAEIAKKCAGLPLLILKVATDLQMKESYMWDDKLKQLSDLDNEEIQKKVHLVLKLSYDNLPRSELRLFFLLCGLFGQSNIQIQNLLKYGMGVGLFKHIATVEEARNKVYTLIDELKAECLLLDGDMNGYVKMHDIVRDTALLIASKEQHIFIGTSGAGLGELPTKDCTRISIPYCDIQALPQGMECPKADLLSVFTEDLSLDIPPVFFYGIRRLKVVDFTGMCFKSLPSSLGFLTNLHSLCLHRCHLYDIAIIGEQKQLEVLSLADSYIVELPRQIEQLSRLKLLDIGNCSNLKVIPANVLSKFSMLEELYVSNSFVEWEAEAISNQGNASLAELEGLSHLRTLEIQVLDAKIIPKALFFNGLQRYRILIGDVWGWHGNFETSRTLKLKLKTSSYLEHGIRVLLRETEDLYLDEVRGIENGLYDVDGEGFPRLKHFHFQNDVLIQRIISSPKWAPYPAFPILESLFLENLMNLETICHGQLARGSFSKLRSLEVGKCQRLEAMIIDESEYNNEVVEFNQLRSLKLNDLPNLRSFCWKRKVATGTEARQKQLTACPLEEIVSEDELGAELSLFNRMVSFPNLEELQLTSVACERIWNDQLSATCSNLTSLIVYKCNNLKHLFTTSIVKCLLQLKKLTITHCDSMEEILLTEELVEEEEERIKKTAFSNDQLSAACSNLTSLTVKNCNNLKHLFTTSIVKCLLQLKKLEIRSCNSMEEILLTEELVEEEEEERINKTAFSKLESLLLENLPHLSRFCTGYSIEFQCLRELTIRQCSALVTFVAKTETNHNTEIQPLFDEMVSFSKLEVLKIDYVGNLKNIWHNQLAADSFCKLKSLSINRCYTLMTVFPLAVLERFQRLENLDLMFCDSVQEIYQLQGYNVKEVNVASAFALRDLHIYACHSLKHIWSKDPQGVFTLQNLKSVYVGNCNVLKNIFPASIAQGLLKLEKLDLGMCKEVEEIVAQEEGVDLKNIFPQLHTLIFSHLPKLRSFYSGGTTNTFEWPKLKFLEVENCDKVRKFGSEISDEKEVGQQSIPIEKPLFFWGKVSPKLEELTLDHKDLSAIQHGLLPFQCFSKLRVLNLLSLRNESRPFLILILKRVSHLDKICVSHSYLDLEELFSPEGLAGEEEHAIARILTRVKKLELRFLYCLKCIWNQDSRVQPLLQCLQTLTVSHCVNLINVAPSSSFLSLTTLEVYSCGRLKNLIMASTAKSMVQLSKMIIQNCEMMTEIVASDGDHNEDEIIFCKLKYLELSGLRSLTSFCTGNHVFNFPSLEVVIVTECFRMTKFSGGFLITPKLRGIRLNKYADKQHWEGNLNETIVCQLTKMQVGARFQVSEFPELWNGKIQGKLFHNVESLTVDTRTFTSNAISAHLLQFLNKLREINVKHSDSLEVVFDLEGLSSDNGHVGLLPRLSKLKLMNLPMLRQLWNKHPHGILDFKNLRLLQIENCSSLRYICTGSMALCLSQLQEVKLKYCNMMEGIIEVEEANKMIFPSLKSVILECLPKFSNFCSRSSNLECPSLKKMSIYDCPSMKTFFSTLLREQKPKGNGEGREQRQDKEEFDVPFSHKMFPKLKELSLDSKSVMMLLQSEFPTEFCSKLKVVELRFFPDKSCASLFRFLPKLPNLEELGVRDSSLEELFVLKGLGGDQKDTITPLRIRALKLSNLGDLINLALSSATFQNLTTLKVSNCNGLKNMLTSTAAKSMVQLEILTVNSCDMLMEIVGGEHRETTEEIVFTKLKTLELVYLRSLTSFCLGSYTLKFPSLEQVTVVICPNLRIFNPGVLSTPKLQSVEVAGSKFHWERDLNATIEHVYEKAIGFDSIRHVKLSNFPTLIEKWHGQSPFNYFKFLRRLVVDECAFFSNAISSNLLKHLSKALEELAVERCDSVEEVFDLEGLNADEGHLGLTRKLNELRLIDLPRLRHVWNKDPQGFLSFKNLKLLQVHNCSYLANIFTLSMALGLVNLQHMEVKRCRMVEHIIRKEADYEIGRDRTIFPSLHSISIECLPNLSCFYSARDVLKCPSLKKIDVVDCPKMELLASAFSYEQDSSAIVEGSEEDVDISMAAFFGGKVAIPSLEELKVEWKTMKDMWPEKFQSMFLSGLKGIELTCYPGGCALLPTDFFQILINLEKLVLRDASLEEKTFHEANIGEQVHPESWKVPMLKHLMEKDSQQVPASQYLETETMDCGRLKILLPFTVSFENLTTLEVSNCQGLINLMTSITSRSLVQLRRMKVEKCEMMQEIVASETDDEEEEICFSQLQYLELHDLPRLTSFCSGNPAFNFPSLEEVIIRACPNMKIFAKEVLSTPKLWRVQTGKHKYEWEWEGSINNTIEALFTHTNAEEIGEASIHTRELQ